MKNICLFLVLISATICVSTRYVKISLPTVPTTYNYNQRNIIQTYILLRLLTGLKTQDNREELCSSDVNLACVRNYFMRFGDCSVVTTPKTDVIYDTIVPFYAPSAGFNVISTSLRLSNVNGEIQTFYKDNSINSIIMSVFYKDVYIHSSEFNFIVNKNGAEPIIIQEFGNATYTVTVTAVIPSSNGLTANSLKEGMYSAYVHETKDIIIGPKYTESEDPTVMASVDAYMENTAAVVKEFFTTKASLDFLSYLQNNVCDFDLQPESLFPKSDLAVVNSIIDNNNAVEMDEPCAGSDDINKCVLDFFEEMGTCSVIRQPSDEKVFREIITDYLPFINSTLNLYRTDIWGLDGDIKTFYINKKTNNLVMTVDFNAISMDIDAAELIIHRKGESPIIVTDYSKPVYDVSLNAVINLKDGLTAKAVENAYITATEFRSFSLRIGDKFFNSGVPQVDELIEDVFTSPLNLGKELFVTEGPYCFLAYLQTRVCDFGIKLP